ncbi:telomerase protein component 1-like, partial [Lagopus leucura]|uniref:telomerase protein component 1-like n=1 Tax=Lagopus leucura TaxID=30410 RepID=UPI001C677065
MAEGGAAVTSSELTSEGVTSSAAMTEEELRQLKLALVSAACSALQCDGAELQQRLRDLSAAVAPHSPEFLLQVALYTRRHLALRSVSCFLLALAAILAPCRPHLRRYFGAIVRLPSDWVAVPRFFQVGLTPKPP